MIGPLEAELSEWELWPREELAAHFPGDKDVPINSLAFPLPAIIVVPQSLQRIRQLQLAQVLLARAWDLRTRDDGSIPRRLKAPRAEIFGPAAAAYRCTGKYPYLMRQLLATLSAPVFLLPQLECQPRPISLLTHFEVSTASVEWTFNEVLPPLLQRWAAWSWLNLPALLNLRLSVALWLFAAASAKLIAGTPEWIMTIDAAGTLVGHPGRYEKWGNLYDRTIARVKRDLLAANVPIEVECRAVKGSGRRSIGVLFRVHPRTLSGKQPA